jgi:hypothetical protein
VNKYSEKRAIILPDPETVEAVLSFLDEEKKQRLVFAQEVVDTHKDISYGWFVFLRGSHPGDEPQPLLGPHEDEHEVKAQVRYLEENRARATIQYRAICKQIQGA